VSQSDAPDGAPRGDGPLPPVVALTGVVKRFGSFTANDHVDLTIRRGEIHALLGENGAGKSTLVKILYGLLQPDEGSILIDGVPTVLTNPAEARQHGIGMVFQHFSLFENLTSLENIALGLAGARPDAALRERVLRVGAEYGLGVQPERPVWSLSAGERQRIEILRCLLQAPRLIVLDEPTSVLTPAEAESLFVTLAKLVAAGTSILFISHKLDEVRRHCQAATVLRRGRVVATLDPRRETARSLAEQMVGESVGDVVAGTHTAGDVALSLQHVSTAPADSHQLRLDDVNLTVAAGEIVAIAGIAGNGQSELFAVVSGESGPPAAGSLRLFGRDAGPLDINARRAMAAAFVPEERLGHAALPAARLSRNLLLSWHGDRQVVRGGVIDWSSVRAVTAKIIHGFDVRASAPDPEARRLSGGNLQKFVVGREVARAPRFLMVNQPSWGIDAAAARAVRQSLVDQAAAGAAVLVISQDLDEVFEIADRIAVIAEGRLSPAVPARETDRNAVGLLMTRGRETDPGGRDAA